MGNQAEQKFNDFGPALLKRLLSTSQGMHYQAAERALLLLNSDSVQKMVKGNMNIAYPIVVRGLFNNNQQQHWHQTVVTITYSVNRSYRDINIEKYEKIMQQAQTEKQQKTAKQRDIEQKWEILNQRYRIPE